MSSSDRETSEEHAEGSPFVSMRQITKKFHGIIANDQISLDIEAGEVRGLLGENGAGKSTLMKILYGLHRPDSGEILLDGRTVDIESPQDAIDNGIGMVHQHFQLVPSLTVTENVILGLRESSRIFHDEFEPDNSRMSTVDYVSSLVSKFSRMLTIDRHNSRARVSDIAEQYGLDINTDARVWQLGVGEKQRVEILKALYRDIDLLILDEPTAVLTPTQIERLFDTIERLVEEGLTIIFITHKLHEVMEITDRVTVLREGSVVDTVNTTNVTESELARMMVGREVLFEIERRLAEPGRTILEATDLRTTNERGIEALSGVDLRINSGEIVGIAGVTGNGMKELGECLAGVRSLDSGSIEIAGTDVTDKSTREFVDSGVGYIPEDRLKSGCAPEENLVYNSVLKSYRDDEFRDWGGFGLDYERAREYAEEIVDRFDVRVVDVDIPIKNLSGGNLQKFILGRELIRDPDIIVANQPTRGLDVGAIEFVINQLYEQRDEGAGVVFISEDLDELLNHSDRILVMFEGEIVYQSSAEDFNRERIAHYMTSGEPEVRDESDSQNMNEKKAV